MKEIKGNPTLYRTLQTVNYWLKTAKNTVYIQFPENEQYLMIYMKNISMRGYVTNDNITKIFLKATYIHLHTLKC